MNPDNLGSKVYIYKFARVCMNNFSDRYIRHRQGQQAEAGGGSGQGAGGVVEGYCATTNDSKS